MIDIRSIEIGDEIRYKRPGETGSYEAVVTGIGLKKIGIKIYSYMGRDLVGGPQFKNVSPRSCRKIL